MSERSPSGGGYRGDEGGLLPLPMRRLILAAMKHLCLVYVLSQPQLVSEINQFKENASKLKLG